MKNSECLLFIALLKKSESQFNIEEFTQSPCTLIGKPKFYSRYYENEMGTNLVREFYFLENKKFSFLELIEWKKKSKLTEEKYAQNTQRTVNLDPGIISKHQVVVTTFKNYAHRIEIAPEIYADLQFTYQEKTFTSLPWTYPDYMELKDQFTKVRLSHL